MHQAGINKYRAAVEVLQRGRDQLVEALAEDVVDQADDLLEGGFLFNEFLEAQGTRLHFLSLLMSQLEQSAELFEETHPAPPPEPPAPKKKRPRAKKPHRATQASPENSGSPDEP